jgi:hypothetical protein
MDSTLRVWAGRPTLDASFDVKVLALIDAT